MLRLPRMSLASKCRASIALAIALMLGVCTFISARRMAALAYDQPEQRARDLADALLSGQADLSGSLRRPHLPPPIPVGRDEPITISLIPRARFEVLPEIDPFVAAAIERFELRADADTAFVIQEDLAGVPYYRHARAIRRSDLPRIGLAPGNAFSAGIDATQIADPLEMILLIEVRDEQAPRRAALNVIHLAAAAIAAAVVGILAFWLLISKVVLTPIRLLTGYAQRVNRGESNLRAEIHTGDEYQELAGMFNDMLDRARKNEAELRALNKGLDLKLGELAESNVALFEANKVKDEFLANVSHELRTPLNSIAGFAEVLRDTLATDDGDPMNEKRRRYAQNILTSSNQLLDLINDLLHLAKIEAGRLERRIGPVSLADTCEGLVTLIRPMAEKRGVRLRLKTETNLPLIETDAGRLQQILFNFLANAVKFSPRDGTVILGAARVTDEDSGEPAIRLAVSDTGPGIAPADHPRIFEKFTQLDASATREQGGTGLGLTICRDLAELLQGSIEVESDIGKGATFSLTIPLSIKPRTAPLMPEGE